LDHRLCDKAWVDGEDLEMRLITRWFS
jgi:hypothetical protein